MFQGAGGTGRRNSGRDKWQGRPPRGDLGEHPPQTILPCQGSSNVLRLTQGLFGYNSVTPIAKAILQGTCQYPPDFDEATKEILQECALIRIRVPKNSVTTTITPEDWTNHWRRAREETSSSTSGRHFGHYKAGLQSQYVSYLQALQATLVVKRGIVLERWSNGLSVMLEKIFGCY